MRLTEPATSAFTALTVVYGAPTPGCGSRYSDDEAETGGAAFEARTLGALALRDTLLEAGSASLGELLRGSVARSRTLSGHADPRVAAYLAPLLKAAYTGRDLGAVLDEAGARDVEDFARTFGESGGYGLGPRREYRKLASALGAAVGGREVSLRDVMRFAAKADPLAREYASGFEVVRELVKPAVLVSLSRADSARAAVVQAYLETLAELPDADVAARAGEREAAEVSRMARGVVKGGGAHSRRGLEGISNLDGLLREDSRLAPTATEQLAVAAAYLVCSEYGPETLGRRLRPTAYRNRGR